MQEGNAYTIPDISLLCTSKQYKTIATKEANAMAAIIEAYLADNGILGQIIEIRPRISKATYVFMPDSGTFKGLDTTIQNLLREVIPSVGSVSMMELEPDRVYISIRNRTRYTARMGDIVSCPAFRDKKVRIPWGVGYAGTHPTVLDLVDTGPVIMLGYPKADIQTILQSLIISILYSFSPEKCRLTLINTAHPELDLWAKIPYLSRPIAHSVKSATTALQAIVDELESRQALQNATLRHNMPYMIVIIDEFAPLMTGPCGTQVETAINRIAYQGPRVGIFPIIATRRVDIRTQNLLRMPVGDILTVNILHPFKSRFLIQDTKDERWTECIFPWLNKTPPLMPVQMPYIDPSEVIAVADFIEKYNIKEKDTK